jgi:hypothetical protein
MYLKQTWMCSEAFQQSKLFGLQMVWWFDLYPVPCTLMRCVPLRSRPDDSHDGKDAEGSQHAEDAVPLPA